jgi:hypothetical protein
MKNIHRNRNNSRNPTHPYVRHLLEDIKSAHRGNDSYSQFEDQGTLEDHLEQMERWIAGEFDHPEHTFGYYCGLGP